MFYNEKGVEMVSITVGDEIVYNGAITKKDIEKNNGESIYSYQFYEDVEGVKVPIVLSEIYNPSNSNVVPVRFFLVVTNAYSKEMVNANIFEGISRAR